MGRNRYHPEIGHRITINFPGERGLATVKAVVNANAVIAELTSTPVGKGQHGYVKGSIIPCRRRFDEMLHVEIWEAVSERELQEAEAVQRFTAQETQAAPEPTAAERLAAGTPLEAKGGIGAESEVVPRGTAEPSPAPEPEPVRKRVLGPRRSKIAKPTPPETPKARGPRRSHIRKPAA